MENILSWPFLVMAVVAYFLCLVFYRLTLHPLAKFPGPKWAAITRYYEGYFDVIQKGQYTFKIAEMHRKYGPIIRISPYELHVNDPAFFDTLYRNDARYDKYAWAQDAFSAKGATLLTPAHEVHKARRQPLGLFFSRTKVISRQDLIHKHLDKLDRRLAKFAETGTTFDFGAAATAFSRDVAMDFILNKSYNSLDSEDFDIDMMAVSRGSGSIWRLTKFIRWVGPAMQAIPIPWIMSSVGEEMKSFLGLVLETREETKRLMAAATSPQEEDKASRTIVHEIMDSNLPPSEKEFERVFQEVSVTAGAGFETIASVARLLFFHIFSNTEILQRLRTDLTFVSAGPKHQFYWKTLEQLPYLTATVMEGLRLSPAIATRMARIAPHTDLVYDKWRIPAGTPVGMTVLLMHTDGAVYPEPEVFKPERWIIGDTLKKTHQIFAPFSKGTRICLGMHLAWAEIYILVANIVQRFDLYFEDARSEDFDCVSDSFAIDFRGKGVLKATVAHHHHS